VNQESAPRLSSVSAFFPCYNDANTIAGLVQMAETALRRITDDYEIIVVDDASTDASATVLAGLVAAWLPGAFAQPPPPKPQAAPAQDAHGAA